MKLAQKKLGKGFFEDIFELNPLDGKFNFSNDKIDTRYYF